MTTSSVAFGLALLIIATSANAEINRCKGNVEWGGDKTEVQIDISLPEKIDGVATVSTPRGSKELTHVGLGRIEIRELVEGRKTHKRTSDLYVTSLDTGIITGFHVEGTQVYILRFSPNAKSFSYFDSFRERTVAGGCE